MHVCLLPLSCSNNCSLFLSRSSQLKKPPSLVRCNSSFSTETDPVVLVTGGNGFLGQHIVKLLHLKSKAKEIVVLDSSPFRKMLGMTQHCKFSTTFSNNDTNPSKPCASLTGAQIVILPHKQSQPMAISYIYIMIINHFIELNV